jgi:hypothetical protein
MSSEPGELHNDLVSWLAEGRQDTPAGLEAEAAPAPWSARVSGACYRGRECDRGFTIRCGRSARPSHPWRHRAPATPRGVDGTADWCGRAATTLVGGRRGHAARTTEPAERQRPHQRAGLWPARGSARTACSGNSYARAVHSRRRVVSNARRLELTRLHTSRCLGSRFRSDSSAWVGVQRRMSSTSSRPGRSCLPSRSVAMSSPSRSSSHFALMAVRWVTRP